MEFSEKELEDWFFENPQAFPIQVDWMARQLKLPSGIADVVGYSEDNESVILVELKSEPFKSRHLCQVKRYEADILKGLGPNGKCKSYVIATGQPSNHLQMEADAVGVTLLTASASFTFNSGWGFNSDFIDECQKQIDSIELLQQMRKFSDEARKQEASWRSFLERDSFSILIEDWYASREAANV